MGKAKFEKCWVNWFSWKRFFYNNQKGLNVLRQNLDKIDLRFLKSLDEDKSFEQINDSIETHIEENKAPEELIENAQALYSETLQKELIFKLKQVDPIRFEQIVLLLFEK